MLSIFSFLLAFVFFVLLAMPNEFELPSNSGKLRDHSASLTEWYGQVGAKDSGIDDSVSNDLKRLLIDQLSNAIEHNRPIIERRLSARNRTILFLIAGFAFLILSEFAMLLDKLS